MAPSVLPPPTKPLLSFKNDDLLVTALTAIATCEDFNLEDFLADRPSSTSTTSTTASSNGPTSLTSFTLFTKLFPELQLKIWAHAYANLKPRNLTIEPPLVKVPALLQTCFDSRKIGLEIYTRQEHAARPGIPAFISIIDFEKDSLNLTQRGEFENPQPENQKHNRYVYNESLNYIIINYDDNLLMYALHHYPELCKRIKRVAIRSCYISWLGKLEMYTDKLSIEGFFKKRFPTLERVGVVATGVGEDVNSADRWAQDEAWRAVEKVRDKSLFSFLERASKQGRLKYHSAGPGCDVERQLVVWKGVVLDGS